MRLESAPLRIREVFVHRGFVQAGRLCGLLAGLALCSCGAPEGGTDLESTGQVKEEILNGAVGDPTNSGYAELMSLRTNPMTSYCSAVFIRNQWVLTARHCIGPGGGFADTPNPPYTASELAVRMGSQLIPVYALATDPNYGDDVAILLLQQPATLINANFVVSTTGYKRQFDKRTVSSVVNETFFCEGYGGNDFYHPPLTYGYLKAFNGGGNQALAFHRNTSNQIQEHGDSGGGCMQDIPLTIKPLTGIHSNCDDKYNPTVCYDDPAVDWATWVEGVLSYFGAL